MKRRHLILLLGGGSAAAASTGTGAFSSASADREVSVNVVEDDEAYLGLEERSGGGDILLIKNQFVGTLSVELTATVMGSNGEFEVELKQDDGNIEIEVEPDDTEGSDSEEIVIGSGRDAMVTVEFEADTTVDLRLRFFGEVGDGGTTVDKTRVFSVEGDDDDDETADSGDESSDTTVDVTKIKFFGSGEKVKILTTENEGGGGGRAGTVDAKLYRETDDGVESNDEFESVQVDEDLYGEAFNGGLAGEIVGVEVEGISGVFVAPENGAARVDRGDTETDPFED